MGRIKTQLIKRKTHEILDKFGDKFTEDYKENKKILDGVADIPSKKMRNVVAGYLTRLKKKEESI